LYITSHFLPWFVRYPFSVSLALGVLIGSGFAPVNFIAGPFIGLGLFFYAINHPIILTQLTMHKLTRSAWFLGMGYYVAGLYWIACALHVQIEQYWYLVPLAVLGIPAICALIPMVATGLTLHGNFKKNSQKIICFSLVWFTLEWIRGHNIFGGFPWLMLSDIWIAYLPFAQMYAVVGNYGLTLITLLIILSCACCKNWRQAIIIIAALAVWFTWGTLRLQQTTTLDTTHQVVLVQPNIKQVDKWQPHLLRQHVDQLTAATDIKRANNVPTVFIFPESAIAYRLNQEPQLCRYITQHLRAQDTLLAGSTRSVNGLIKQLYNSLYILEANGNIKDTYDKVHLTPFGEYIPLHSLFPDLIRIIMGQQTDFSFGQMHKVLRSVNSLTILPLICYEGIFFDEIHPQQKYDWIVNVTNDAWFLNSSGPQQHFAMICACAITWGTPIVRVANTGISGIIDGHGRVVDQLGYGQQGVIVGHVPHKLKSKTLFARYGNTIVFFIYGALLVILLISHIVSKRRQVIS